MNDRLYGLGYLRLSDALRVEACNAGLFVSPAQGIHHGRVIDSYELILARTGTLVLSEETTVFALEQGDTLILWPGRFHRGVAPYAPNTSFYWVHFFLRADALEAHDARRAQLAAVEANIVRADSRRQRALMTAY